MTNRIPGKRVPANQKDSCRGKFLYVMREEGGSIKVGVANNAQYRRRTLQGGNPRRLMVIALWEFERRAQAYSLERAVHLQYADDRIGGEWFRTSADEMITFIEAVT